MKKILSVFSGILFYLFVLSSANADFINGGFETGDLTGWEPSVDGISVVSSYNDNSISVIPVEGNSFALIDMTIYDSEFTDAFISQDINLNSGDQISGKAAFYNFENNDTEYAWITIYDYTTAQYHNINWHSVIGQFPWTDWSWTAPSNGNYIVMFGVQSLTTNSVAMFDMNKVNFDPTDENPYFQNATLPSSVILPGVINFSGYAKDDNGLSTISMSVNGQTVFADSISGTSVNLSPWFFDSSNTSYANIAGSYTVSLTTTDTAGHSTDKSFTVNVSAADTAPFGINLGSFNGVPSFSNCSTLCTTCNNDCNSYNYIDGKYIGIKWQCVEYVRRYFYQIYGLDLAAKHRGNANTFYANATKMGLNRHANGDKERPNIGDILVSEGGGYGHVAIVRSVSSNQVCTIQQNFSNITTDANRCLSMTISNGNYNVSGFSSSYPIKGWLRAKNAILYDAEFYAQDPIDPTYEVNSTHTFTLSYTNTGTDDWKNTGGVSNPQYIELRSTNSSGIVVDSAVYPNDGTWINRQRVVTLNAPNVGPSQNGWFVFNAKMPSTPGDYYIYFQPYHATGGLIGPLRYFHINVIPATKTTTVLTKTSPNLTINASTNARVYGTALSNQITLESGAKAELINFSGQNSLQIQSSSDLFTVSRSGTIVTFEGSDGTILKTPATTSVQTVDFSDRLPMTLHIHGGQVMLDDQVVTATAAAIDSESGLPGPCGAYVAPGVWKEFNCYNLAAIGKTTNDDPFTPSWRLIGGYWQWGRKGPDPSQWYDTNTPNFAHGPTGPNAGQANEGEVSGWDQTSAPNGAWSNKSQAIYYLLDQDADMNNTDVDGDGSVDLLGFINITGLGFVVNGGQELIIAFDQSLLWSGDILTHENFVAALQPALAELIANGMVPTDTTLTVDNTMTDSIFLYDGSKSRDIPAIVLETQTDNAIEPTGFKMFEGFLMGEYYLYGHMDDKSGNGDKSQAIYYLLDQYADMNDTDVNGDGSVDLLANININGLGFVVNGGQELIIAFDQSLLWSGDILTHENFVAALQPALAELIANGMVPPDTTLTVDNTMTDSIFLHDGSRSRDIPAIVLETQTANAFFESIGFKWVVDGFMPGEYSVYNRMDYTSGVSDPCPAGFRVPTISQWEGVINNNTQSTIGTWDSADTNYSSARFIGDSLMLPAAGVRSYNSGALIGRNAGGNYWSNSEYSHPQSSSDGAWFLYFDSDNADTYFVAHRREGLSVRCIADDLSQSQDLYLGKNTLTLDSGDSETVSIIGGTGYYFASSSNSQVATPVIAGSSVEVTGFSPGTATITVEDNGGGLASISVTVTTTASGDCGAYVAPGVWKEFDCYNLAAIGKETGADPFTPSWKLIGGYWQWGRKGPDPSQWYDTNTEHFAHGPTGPGIQEANEGEISGWDDNYAPDGAWTDSVKTANDPCPAGYRVPTKTQWDGVRNNNTQSTVGTWSSGYSDYTNYNAARFFGDKLMLPATGYRSYGRSGALSNRGYYGNYRSSSDTGGNTAWYLYFTSGNAGTRSNYRGEGFSVRCVAE